MSEPITQWEIFHEARNHLSLIEPLLERIGGGSSSQVGIGYVEVDNEGEERFTDTGWDTVTALRIVALNSAGHLWNVLADKTGRVDARLLGDVQEFLAILASALRGLEHSDIPVVGANPPWVATCLLGVLRTLQERAEAEQEPELEMEASS